MATLVETKLDDRVENLRRKAQDGYSQRMYDQRQVIFQRVLGESTSDSQVVRVAKSLAAFLREKEIVLNQDDLFAGHEQYYDYSLPGSWRTDAEDAGEAPFVEEFRKGYRIGLFCGVMGGHVIAGYDRVLRMGFGAMAEAARDRLATASTALERDFATASRIVCEGASDYAIRYAQKAKKLACTLPGTENRERLERIGEACEWVATRPPRSFFEAVQLLWLTHEILTCEQTCGSLSLGRLDQYLYPFYASDIAAGDLTVDEASELIECLWVKLGGMKKSFQNVTLGGLDSRGTFAANALSYMCLRATKKVRMDQPLLSVRWHPSIPADFWREVEELLQEGMGFPALFNDEVVIAAKRRVGVAEPDALNYGIVGCVEPCVPGKEFSHTEGIRVNWAKVLELMLNDGTCTVTGETVKMHRRRKLDTIGTFDEFYQWYREELEHFTELGVNGLRMADASFSERLPYPFLSSTMEGCLEKGRDVTAGGTIYNFSSVNGLGMANAVDSLIGIKSIVFRDRRASLPELAQALRNDFEGAELLRQALLNCPKYGNDRDKPDGMMRDLTDCFCHRVESHRNPRSGRVQTGLYTVEYHARLGPFTGALPDGRRRGLALANGLSPSQGADTSGPTAVMKSNTKVNHRRLANGMVLDLKFEPSFFAEMRRLQVFRPLVEAYFKLGGLEVQFNVVSRETLIAAQKSPEQYRHLLVRVSGFSAYFVELDKICQDEIIARTEHATIGECHA